MRVADARTIAWVINVWYGWQEVAFKAFRRNIVKCGKIVPVLGVSRLVNRAIRYRWRGQ